MLEIGSGVVVSGPGVIVSGPGVIVVGVDEWLEGAAVMSTTTEATCRVNESNVSPG